MLIGQCFNAPIHIKNGCKIIPTLPYSFRLYTLAARGFLLIYFFYFIFYFYFWQDILLSHSIHASRVTVWPIDAQCLKNPMYLENEWFSSFNSIINDMDMVITLLMPGVKEISSKCGSRSANRLRLLLQKIHHLQRDAHKYADLIFNVMTAEQA